MYRLRIRLVKNSRRTIRQGVEIIAGDDDHRQKQRESKEKVEKAILQLAETSTTDFTADDVRALLGEKVLNDPDFKSEMMGGACSALAQRNLIKSLGSRTSQFPGMKNPRVAAPAT
jgi:hypothetical protein